MSAFLYRHRYRLPASGALGIMEHQLYLSGTVDRLILLLLAVVILLALAVES